MQRDGVIAKYAIGGAVGAAFYLEPASTVDIDIFVMLPSPTGSQLLSLAKIYDYLQARGYKTKAEYVVIGGWPVQFLPASTQVELEALNYAVEADAEGVKTWIMTAEHLVAICLQTGRAKDYARIVQFFEQKAVDAERFHELLERHGLEDKWESFERRYFL